MRVVLEDLVFQYVNSLVQGALTVEVISLFAGGMWDLVSSFELVDH